MFKSAFFPFFFLSSSRNNKMQKVVWVAHVFAEPGKWRRQWGRNPVSNDLGNFVSFKQLWHGFSEEAFQRLELSCGRGENQTIKQRTALERKKEKQTRSLDWGKHFLD